ncbi:Alpha/Beta hydrolase protein [Aspergillus ambiguus]|uniref:alpha/beta hydrolase n=1 Tax=Aspergillus ambiguus TaxID=176160 RepID=UPI003CCD8B0C
MEYTTREAVLALAQPDPEFEAFIAECPLPKRNPQATLEQMREEFARAEELEYASFAKLGVEEAMTIPMRDGYQSHIRICKPPTLPADGSPLVALIYGGGFAMGTNRQLSSFAHSFTAAFGATVVLLSYRLAPEHKFPTAPRDIWDSVQWLSMNASDLGADTSQGFIIGGFSAGAALAIVTAHQAVRDNLSFLTGLWTCHLGATDGKNVPEKYKPLFLSREQNKDAPCLTVEDIDVFQALYAPDFTSEDYVPFVNESTFAKMFPTYVQVAGLDPLRDDGLVYEKALRDAGVKTRLDVYPGVPHGHHLYFPWLKQSLKTRRDAVEGLGWLLGREIGVERAVLDRFFSSFAMLGGQRQN